MNKDLQIRADLAALDALDIVSERLKGLEKISKLYYELLFQVSKIYPGETRHETARRYLRDRETILGHGESAKQSTPTLTPQQQQ